MSVTVFLLMADDELIMLKNNSSVNTDTDQPKMYPYVYKLGPGNLKLTIDGRHYRIMRLA